MKLARGSTPWLVVPAALVLLCGALALVLPGAWPWVLGLAAAAALLTFLFFLQFFRDPEREPAAGVVSAADGKVVLIDRVEDADLGTCDRLAVFMSPKDVHVNRFPLDATVVSVRHVPGGHLPAFRKESERNERVETILDTELGRIKVVQIAGTVARRIVPYIAGGETVRKGDRLGLIRLGSRCDLLVPPATVRWTVALGEQVHGASTTVAEPVPAAAPAGAPTATGKPRPASPKPPRKGARA